MDRELDRELRKLIVGTNDQRRRVGQTLYHFYRTLIFWRDKGLSFRDVTRAWSAAGAMVFDNLAATLRELEPHERDEPLRRHLAEFLEHLADDLHRGDHMMVPFLRWLETRFPVITEMMRSEQGDSRLYDVDLAEALSQAFAACAREDREGMVRVLRAAAAHLRD